MSLLLGRFAADGIRTAVERERAQARAERQRILRAFDELAHTYVRNAELHRQTLPHAAQVENHHADDLRRIVALFGGIQ